MRELYKKLGINASLTTAYHPQSNSQMERTNQEVEKYLQLFCDKCQDDWVNHLPTMEFVFNSRVSSATGYSLFKIMYRYRPDFTVPLGQKSSIPVLDQCLKDLAEVRKEAEAALCLSKEHMKESHNSDKALVFKEGDKVMLTSKDIKIHEASQKLGPHQIGPFTVVQVRDNDNSELDLPPVLKIHPVFHVN